MVFSHEMAMSRASKVFDYYYAHAIQEFDHITSSELAQIPADYVYNNTEEYCLEYLLDHEFERLDPEIKRHTYEKAFNVKTGFVSESEINIQLKKRRNNVFKKLYYNRFRELKENKENIFCGMFKNISLNGTTTIDNIFKTLNLN